MQRDRGALPEFIVHGENGILLPLDTNEVGEWAHIGRGDRASDDYAAMFDSECDRLASVMLDELQALLGQPDRYAAMRQSAKAQAKRLFSSQDANAFWDGVYEGALHK